MKRLLLAMVLLVAGCRSLTGADRGVDLVLAGDRFAPAQTVTASFVNQTDQDVGYGACSLFLERRVSGAWVQVGPPQVPCISILYVLRPGASVVVQLALPADVPAGVYRLRQEYLPDARLPGRSVHSASFEVR